MKDYFFDFHLHSCLSPCADDEMTPATLAAMCSLAGYDVVALTDHNATENCPAFCNAARKLGLLAIPGMELTCEEEVHVICLFAELDRALAFGELVLRHLPPLANRPDFFGRQLVMNSEDRILREETALLSGATDISLHEVPALVAQFGGIAYPAHIDRSAFSLLSNLGFWNPEINFPLAERSLQCPPDLLLRPDLAGVRFITGCDAHHLEQIPDPAQSMSLSEKSPLAVLDWLRF